MFFKTIKAKLTLGLMIQYPSTVGRELEYVQKAIANQHIAADGYFTNECNEYFKNKIGIKKSLLTTSCTHALEAIMSN